MKYQPNAAYALCASLLVVSVFAACSGGGGSVAAPTPSLSAPLTSTSRTQFSITIPNRSAAAHGRSPLFVSSGTNGLSVSVAFQSAPGTAVATSAIDVSANSTVCTTGPNGRTCTLFIDAPVSPSGTTDVFTFTSFDTAPSGGAIASTAKALATGVVALAVIKDKTNTFDVSLNGTPASVQIGAKAVTFIGDRGPIATAVPAIVKDAAGQTIVGAFSAPVAVASNETHTTLALGTGPGAASVSLTSSGDAANLTAKYDGLGSAGYTATISASAPVASLQLNAMTVSGTPYYLAPTLGISANHQATFTVTEANFAGTFVQSTTCTGAAVVSAFTQSANAATLTVTGGLTTANCTITIGDGTFTYPAITVQNTVDGSSPVPLPSPTSSTGATGTTSSPVPLPTGSSVGSVGASPSPVPLPT